MSEEFRTTSQAERRRASLVHAAAHLAVTEGLDAVQHARVAELAECARSLVYRYFPSREDLLYAIITTFQEHFAERMRPEAIVSGVMALRSAEPGQVPPETQAMLDTLWPSEPIADVPRDVLSAALMMLRGRDLGLAIGRHEAEVQRLAEDLWQRPMAEIGLRPLEADIAMDCVLAIHEHIVRGFLDGKIDREQALDVYVRGVAAIINAFASTEATTLESLVGPETASGVRSQRA
jgi:AcrR family transcriptional regulator